MIPIHRALISVTDKSNLPSFAKELAQTCSPLQILASSGTAKLLGNENIPFTSIEEYTESPECFGGRVKTLHPKILGGILFRRDIDDEEAKQKQIPPIDLVICNLYDYEKSSEMDIGGSTLIRSACKNMSHVAVVVDPSDYPSILEELKANGGMLSLETRQMLCLKAMELSAEYERVIFETLQNRFKQSISKKIDLIDGKKLRYGENPDQEGWVYSFKKENGIAQSTILSGKELSYNNYEDASIACQAAMQLGLLGAKHACAIIKHGSLCSAATDESCAEAFVSAWEGDSKSAFGSIIAFISPITEDLIPHLNNKFIEVLIAPHFSKQFVTWAQSEKPNVRLIEMTDSLISPYVYKNISGGMLAQTRKEFIALQSFEEKMKLVTKKEPKDKSVELFAFAMAVVAFAKSNAIAIVQEKKPKCYQVIAMGTGQPNRVDCLERLALPKALEKLQNLHNCVLASDGFFPFADSIEVIANSGIQHCIQPGGSIRDDKVIAAADALELCMIFTQERFFYH